MPLLWTDARPATFRDAYLDWARVLQLRRKALPPACPDSGPELEPVFVRLIPVPATDDAREKLRAIVTDPSTPLFMDPHELQALTGRIGGGGPEAGLPDEYALYRSVGTPDSDHAELFEVLDTGMPVALSENSLHAVLPAAVPGTPTAHRPGTPIMALIDDGIGFLNSRFCRHTEHGPRTRFHALWLQTLERGNPDSAEVTAGLVLTRDRIDALLSGGREPDAYARLNKALFTRRSRRATETGTTHGTHVLDLAAGAEPDDGSDPVRDWPLLGVQLPPEAIDDTSGTWFENYLLQGLRWLLRQARGIDAEAPVIVNLSLGIIAGPKDGSRFIEYQMAREAQLWEQVTGQPVRLVWAFGNNQRSNQVARFDYEASAPNCRDREVRWQVQPDDETASYVEIHTRGIPSSEIAVALTTPQGVDSGFLPLAEGELRSLEKDGKALARIYHLPARDYGTGTVARAHYVIALAPSRGRRTGEPEAPSGGWTLQVRHEGCCDATVLLQVQRDDAVRGSRVRGRQSYFDDPGAYGWDAEEMAHIGLTGKGPIRSAGSHSALVTAPVRQVFSCGAARRSATRPGEDAANLRPSGYTSEGADWSVSGPTGSTLADTGSFQSGILAAGTLSGTVRRLNGTSAAAGRMSRALGQSAERIRRNASDPSSVRRDDFDETVLTVQETAPDDHARLGEVLVTPVDRGRG